MADNTKAVENLQEYYKPLKKDGRLYIILFLTMIPGLSFASVKLHVIKLAAKDTLQCEIKSLDNSSWKWEEIRKISQPVDDNKECYIYDYNYSKFILMTLKQSKEAIEKQYPIREKTPCSKFIVTAKDIPDSFAKEFATYCESTRQVFYDIGLLIPYILSCLYAVPLVDIFGRKSVIKIGCQMTLFAVFLKIIFLHYTREVVGEAILHVAYPCLKYATEALVIEVTGKKLKPFGFMVRYIGGCIPPLVASVVPVPSVYWKHLLFITYSPVLILPLMNWFFTESVPWFASRKENKIAEFIGETLEDPVRHNQVLFRLQNRRRSFNDIRRFLQEFRGVNAIEFILINVIAFTVGCSTFYPRSKHKLLYYNLDEGWMKFLDVSGLPFGFILAVPCVYLINWAKFSLSAVLLINGVLYSLMAIYSEFENTIVLIFCTEITSTILIILFEFYLHHVFPTSHRCLCTGLCGASQNFGLLVFIATMHLRMWSSQILASVMCVIGCIFTLLVVKNFKANAPFLNFSDAELELAKKRWNFCSLMI